MRRDPARCPGPDTAAAGRRRLAAGRRGQALAGRRGRSSGSARRCSWSRRPTSSPGCSPPRCTGGLTAPEAARDCLLVALLAVGQGVARLGVGGLHRGGSPASEDGDPAAGAGGEPSAWRRRACPRPTRPAGVARLPAPEA